MRSAEDLLALVLWYVHLYFGGSIRREIISQIWLFGSLTKSGGRCIFTRIGWGGTLRRGLHASFSSVRCSPRWINAYYNAAQGQLMYQLALVKLPWWGSRKMTTWSLGSYAGTRYTASTLLRKPAFQFLDLQVVLSFDGGYFFHVLFLLKN